MLWTLLKVMLFVAAVVGITLGAGYLMESSGGVQIAVGGNEYVLGPLRSVIAALVLVGALWLVFKLVSFLVALLRFINGDETAMTRYFNRNREKKGQKVLTEGLLALAAGDGHTAITKAERAGKLLDAPDLTDLVSAQAAELTGDRRRAGEIYKRLIKKDSTRFVGVRGLMHQKLEDGDTETALKLAEKAFTINPRHTEVQDTLLGLQTRNEDWDGARKTLNAKLRHGNLPRDVHKRRDAVLLLSQALAKGDAEATQTAAIEANRLAPTLVPAAVLASESYLAQKRPRVAAKLLRKAWDTAPHPALAAAFAALAPDETPDERLKRFQPLLRSHAEDRQTRLLHTELCLACEDFPAARRALGDLAENEPDVRALTLMAAIEKGAGAPEAVVRGWLARAVTAPRGPQWICENCHSVQAEWKPVCSKCDSFDTLSWKTPPVEEVSGLPGAELLPLLLGTTEPEAEAPSEADDTHAAQEDPAPVAEILDVTDSAADTREGVNGDNSQDNKVG